MTPDQEDHTTLRLLVDSVKANGYPPSRREITAAIDKVSYSEAQRVVRRLEEQGLVTIEPRVARGLRITRAGMRALTEEMR